MEIILNPNFWFLVMGSGIVLFVLLMVGKKTELLNSTPVAVVISMLIAFAYFNLINHYLMDQQGLDYWYLFRE